jgi:signal transduction histidine kinase
MVITSSVPSMPCRRHLLALDAPLQPILLHLVSNRSPGECIMWSVTSSNQDFADSDGDAVEQNKAREEELELRRRLNLTPPMLSIMEPDGRIPWANGFVAQCLAGSIAVGLLTFVCFRLQLNLATALCLYLIVIVVLSLRGSFISSAFVSLVAVGCTAYYFAPPIFSFRVSDPFDGVAIVGFLTTSAVVTHLVSRVRMRTEQLVLTNAKLEAQITEHKQTQESLQQSQANLASVNRVVRALNEQLIKAQEAERMRIAGELHDCFLQQITSLTLTLGKVKRQVPPDSEAIATVSSLQQQLIQIGTDVRHLSHELHPALLQEAGLPAALSSYCEEFSNVRGLPVSCETDESVKDLSPGVALCLYRIAQEALGNAAKHSEAKKVEVRLTRPDRSVYLSISDDGVGCAPGQIGSSGGLGLINMRERVLQLNGTFEFDSQPGRGATVRVTVPFRPAS